MYVTVPLIELLVCPDRKEYGPCDKKTSTKIGCVGAWVGFQRAENLGEGKQSKSGYYLSLQYETCHQALWKHTDACGVFEIENNNIAIK